eukprot:637385-Amphidinium_carterae.2
MAAERLITLTLCEIQWGQAVTEGGIVGPICRTNLSALVGSWCDWSHRMFKEASAEECRMELTERAPFCWCCQRQRASKDSS